MQIDERTPSGLRRAATPWDTRSPVDALKDLLLRAQGGDKAAREQLFAVAYEELRAQARAQLRGGGRNTLLDTTALVHESYLRFLRAGRLSGAERAQFFAYAAQVMRSVIVDSVRQRLAERRGGGAVHVTLDTRFAEDTTATDEQVIRINDALDSLEQLDARLARVVEMRYFAGMTEEEVAAALGVTDRTVRRDWQKARLLLAMALQP
jgi:RNA polymerase sigma factor (TIGR02999 family)